MATISLFCQKYCLIRAGIFSFTAFIFLQVSLYFMETSDFKKDQGRFQNKVNLVFRNAIQSIWGNKGRLQTLFAYIPILHNKKRSITSLEKKKLIHYLKTRDTGYSQF